MIPTIKQILEGYKAGAYTLTQCLAWMEEHRRLDRLEYVERTPVAWRYYLGDNTGPTFTANADDPFVRAGKAIPLYISAGITEKP